MKKSVKFLIALSLFVISLNPYVKSQVEERSDEQKILGIMQTINSEELYAYVDTLSSDEFEGRLTGSIGYDKSADWAIAKFKKWGVKPRGENDTYFQKFPHPYTDVLKACEVKMVNKKGDVIKNYEYVEEFIPGSTSGNGEVTAEVVYVGYGITAPELGYDDYEGVDVKGKIVLMEKETPVNPDNDDFLKWRPYTFHQYKLLNAVKHGAAGMLYHYNIGNPNNAYVEGFIISSVGEKVVEDIFNGSPYKYNETIKKITETLKPQSFSTGKIFSVKNNTKHHPEGIGSNVIAYIEGSDPVLKNEYIIIGGHLDHLGKCYEMMPGANDNASAVSVILSVAHAMSKLDIKLKRSVVFLLFGAEEAGLDGSRYFLKNTTVKRGNIMGFINMDAVGIGNKINVGFSENYPDLYSYLKVANDKYIHATLKENYSTNIARPRQDAAFFDWYGIPTLSLATFGDLPQNKNYRYHTPYDNISNITPEIMESISKLIFLSVVNIANENKIEFKRGDKKPEFINGYDFQSILLGN